MKTRPSDWLVTARPGVLAWRVTPSAVKSFTSTVTSQPPVPPETDTAGTGPEPERVLATMVADPFITWTVTGVFTATGLPPASTTWRLTVIAVPAAEGEAPESTR